MQTLEQCEGYRKLREKADSNINHGWGADRVNKSFDWAIKRARHYEKKTGVPINDILVSWADQCKISFLNHFQDCNQPEIKADRVKVFDTVNDMRKAIGENKFLCPYCGKVSSNPYECNSKAMIDGKVCDWKVNGLFGDLGKGVYVFVKDKVKGENIFMPIAWERI